MKTLSAILNLVQQLKTTGALDLEITSLVCDSRKVEPGSVFFALPGTAVDGFDYIPQALRQGATVIVAERELECPDNVSFVLVANVRQAMAQMAASYYNEPTAGIPVIGITGTNGKTTTSFLIEAIMQQAGFKPAIFGTIDYRCGEIVRESSHTTPESIELLQLMREFRDLGADALIMEVSSHALDQYRVDGIEFDLGVFTNLTPEHLDYHQNMENYFVSKTRLFNELLSEGAAVVNSDDEYGKRLLDQDKRWISYGRTAADVSADQIRVGREGIQGHFQTPKGQVAIASRMIGDFNVSNLLASVAAAQQLGIDNATIAAGVESLQGVPGRVEAVANDRSVLALVDYAHTGDALEQVLNTLTKLDAGRRLTLVGCGGDRDPAKRAVMAAVAIKYSSLSVFTSDNPRTEDPLEILEQVRQGALAAGGNELSLTQARAGESGFVVIPERRDAIEFAGRLAVAGDLLLVAGKGHEDYQILGTQKIHFDDREEIVRALGLAPYAGGDDV